jgi:UDP-2,3-diacylglucosamine pyrophosphatase LpxH
MTMAFDLISDLHLETWNEQLNFSGQATSPVCVVAGDVSRDHTVVKKFLKHLSDCYAAVFYIDGNDEHRYKLDNLGESYRELNQAIRRIPRLTYLQDNVVVIDGVAILGTNGWWGFDLDENLDMDGTKQWMKDTYEHRVPEVVIDAQGIQDASRTDAAYLVSSVQRLQTHQDVKKIVIVTHTVPDAELIQHDIDIAGNYHFNCMGNRLMRLVHTNDTEHKIHTWCFGHYHGTVDRILNGIRYVNNCRGRGDTPHRNHVYYPKRIEINW